MMVEVFIVSNNLHGQRITQLERGFKPAVTHCFHFDGRSLPGGAYFIRYQMNDLFETRKFLLLK
ncbi:hypothetical protein B6I21_08950 [candidate division KSB1 bacterium 4572_119]|nr:MAG: hypothetical protein B6I21_08950 [candidate division KSB1 bacterium 4572_119]